MFNNTEVFLTQERDIEKEERLLLSMLQLRKINKILTIKIYYHE